MRTRTHLPRLTGELSFELANAVSMLAWVRMPARSLDLVLDHAREPVALLGPRHAVQSASGAFTNE